MAFPLVAIVLAATLASTPLQAADTGPATSPPSARERIDLAREAIRKQDWRRALDELNRAVREEPRNADIHNLLGYSLRKQARPDLPRAFEHYRKAIELDPRHKGAHEYIGEAYLMDRKPQEAEKHLAALQQICGNTTCEEYVDLAKAIADYRLKN
ncbi:MAG: tetratricopeptide repeat protein [Rhodoferax sp.]|nr:tetratricopeptide repeat protein [Rhodoferax sp.]